VKRLVVRQLGDQTAMELSSASEAEQEAHGALV